jgi:hypothetical protein
MDTFYSDPHVRQRLVEYLGGDCLGSASAVYVTHTDGCLFQRSELHPPAELEWFLDRNLDIARSLADRKSLLLHLDIEYVNFDSPGEAFTNPARAFGLQEPVVRAIEELLLEWGIEPLHLITGQGHHFVWRVGAESGVALGIAALMPSAELVAACMARVGDDVDISDAQQATFAGLALVMEYVAHRIKWVAAPLTELPVEITAVHVGHCGSHWREMISVDISEYGDPLFTRMIRMPYTHYLKPWLTGLAREMGMEDQLPRFRAIPLHEMDVQQALACRGDEQAVRELARRAGGKIPLQEKGTARMLAEYMGSKLRGFHREFYAMSHHPKDTWAETYDVMPLESLAPCVKLLLEYPNDRLLKPAGIQLVTRALLALGWHPRHIAGLIRSKFKNPAHNWGVDWAEYEAGTRADFYVRLFAGLWETGVDELVDFNCISNAEKGFCGGFPHGVCSLSPYYETLRKSKNL